MSNLLEQIADAAALVRQRQREYFRLRTTSALHDSKSAERNLDALLKQRDADLSRADTERIEGTQDTLFPMGDAR